jgi:alpha-mannosidase
MRTVFAGTAALAAIFCVLPLAAQTDFRIQVAQQLELARQTDGWLEGFDTYLKGETLNYGSHRDDCREAFLCRTTDGNMEIGWETSAIPVAHSDPMATFLAVAGFDRKEEAHSFELWVNDVRRFTFSSTPQAGWKTEGEEGSTLEFVSFLTDQHGDAQGYLILKLPVRWIGAGNKARIRVRGRAHSEQTWFMVYRCPDALAQLQGVAERELWLDMRLSDRPDGKKLSLEAPNSLAGETILITVGHQGRYPIRLTGRNGIARGEVKMSKKDADAGGKLTIAVPGRPVYEFPGVNVAEEHTLLEPDVLIRMRGTWEKTEDWQLQVEQRLRTDLYRNVQELVRHGEPAGTIHLMSSSHQDIAWMDSPEQCKIDRDVLLITPTLQLLERHPEYRHDMEHVLMLREYLDRHPDRKQLIYDLTRQGRLAWGATYNEPYEEMFGGEALIRQLYLGKKWLEKLFPGVEANVYWNPDVPGRSLQMPQILSRGGVRYMMISRHAEGIFRWASPDGSSIVTYSSSHYGDSRAALKKGLISGIDHLARQAARWSGTLGGPDNRAFPVLSTEDMSPPVDYGELMRTWNSLSIPALQSDPNRPSLLPDIRYSTAETFLDDYMAGQPELPVVSGERPNVWLYIHGPSHQRALAAGRAAGLLLPAAEKFATIRSLLEGNWDRYPGDRLTEAWESAIYPDHGWGGKNGDITDSTFERAFKKGRNMAVEIINESIQSIGAHIAPSGIQGLPVRVFNSLSWSHSGPVEIEVEQDERKGGGLRLRDTSGADVPFQICAPASGQEGSTGKLRLLFIAEQVPPIGYRSFFLEFTRKKSPEVRQAGEEMREIDSRYYHLRLGKGGIGYLYDKELGRPVFDTGKFSGGELFTMRSVGNGAGEFADVQQPDLEGFARLGETCGNWKLVETGPIRTVVELEGPMVHNRARQRITVYHTLKRIDVETDLLDWDGTLYREFRLAFPLNLQKGQVAYEVPFATVRVGKDELPGAAGERYVRSCAEVHPRGIDHWIGASDEQMGFTLASGVAVADYVDPTEPAAGRTLLQPVLLASRHSCHWEGLPYSQFGDHSFRFAFTSHQPGWENGYHFGRQFNEPLLAVIDRSGNREGRLSPDFSFFATDQDNVIISTIKKAEDSDAVIVRCYEAEGVDSNYLLSSFLPVRAVYSTDIIERRAGALNLSGRQVNLKIGHHAIETMELMHGP